MSSSVSVSRFAALLRGLCALLTLSLPLAVTTSARADSAFSQDDLKNMVFIYALLKMNQNNLTQNNATTTQINQADQSLKTLSSPLNGYIGTSAANNTLANGPLTGSGPMTGTLNMILGGIPGYQLGPAASEAARLSTFIVKARYNNEFTPFHASVISRRGRFRGQCAVYTSRKRFADGSVLVRYFSDPKLTRQLGYYAVSAPLWSGRAGVYPALYQAAYDVPHGNGRLKGASNMIINDSHGSSGRLGSVSQDSNGRVYSAVYALSSTYMGETFTMQQGRNSIIINAAYDNRGGQALQVNLSNGLVLNMMHYDDDSGWMTVQKRAGATPVLVIAWDEYWEGFYRFQERSRVWFDDLNDLF